MKNKLQILLFLFFLIIFFSCSERHVYQKYQKIPDYIWHHEQKIPFTFSIKDTVSSYIIYMNLRIATYYTYSNLWINVTKKYPISNKTESKLVEFTLADDKGKWLGKGLGDLYDYQFILEENVHFPNSGKYTYSFNHEMRVDNLLSVMDLGILVKKVKEN